MFERKSAKSISIVLTLALIFLFSCAKQEPKTGFKKIEGDTTQKNETMVEEDLKDATPQSSAANRLVSKGIDEYNKEEYEKAGRTLEAAINMEPNNGQAYYWLAKTNLKMGDMENARQFLYTAGQHLSGDDWDKKLDELKKQIDESEIDDLENEDSNDQNSTDSF